MHRSLLLSLFLLLSTSVSAETKSLFDLEAKSIDGKPIKLSTYAKKVVLVVNTASKCGFTPQYEGLQKLYETYQDKGFVILGFPSNDFLSQEPGSNEEIQKFCKLNYGVSFPLFAKAHVKGKDKQIVFKFLTEDSAKEFQGDPGWNFTKFLVDRHGKVVARFNSMTKPQSKSVIEKIEKVLAEKAS